MSEDKLKSLTTFDAVMCDSVIEGFCVHLQDDKIVYAGPIKQSPDVSGRIVMLNSKDWTKLKVYLDKRRN